MSELSNIDLTVHLALGVGWRHQDSVRGGRIEISNHLAERFREVAFSHMSDLGGRTPRPFSPEVDLEPNREFLVADLAELDPDEPITKLLDGIQLRDPLSIADIPKRPLLFYAIVFPGQVTLIRKLNPHQTANRGKIWTRLGNALAVIEDPVFSFDAKVDMVITSENILVSNIRAFEFLFKEESYFMRHVDDWVKAISDNLPLSQDSDRAIIDRCRTNTRLRRRLESIHRRGHLQNVAINTVREHADKHGLDVDRFIRDDELYLHDVSIEDVLQLLNEDLFFGDFSGVQFAADKKIPR